MKKQIMQISIKSKSAMEMLYLCVVAIVSFFTVINESLLAKHFIYNLVWFFSCGILGFLLISKNNYTLKRFIFKIFIIFVFIIAAYLTRRKHLCLYILMAICAYLTSFRSVVKTTFFATSIALVGIFSLSIIKVLPDYAFFHEGKVAHSLGFFYYSASSYIVLFNTLKYLYLRNYKAKWLEIGVCFLINYIIYRITTVRLSFILIVIVVGLFVFLVKLNLTNINNNFTKSLSVCLFPLSCIMTVYGALKYNNNNPNWLQLDELLNGRLTLSNIALKTYQIPLFGQYIEMHGNEYNKTVHNYFYIDSGYIYSILGYGMLFTITVIILYSILYEKSCKDNNKIIWIWLTATMIFTIVNNSWVTLPYNPLLIFIFTKSETKRISSDLFVATHNKWRDKFVSAKYKEKLHIQYHL